MKTLDARPDAGTDSLIAEPSSLAIRDAASTTTWWASRAYAYDDFYAEITLSYDADIA